MANRISLRVETEKRRIYLPSLPVFTLPFIIKMIIKRSKEQGAQSFYHQNKQTIKKGLKLLVKELRKMEPMELISIESKDAVVNIRLK